MLHEGLTVAGYGGAAIEGVKHGGSCFGYHECCHDEEGADP